MIAQSRPLRARAGKHEEANSGRLPNNGRLRHFRQGASSIWIRRLSRSTVLLLSPFRLRQCNHLDTHCFTLKSLFSVGSYPISMSRRSRMQDTASCNNFRKCQNREISTKTRHRKWEESPSWRENKWRRLGKARLENLKEEKNYLQSTAHAQQTVAKSD